MSTDAGNKGSQDNSSAGNNAGGSASGGSAPGGAGEGVPSPEKFEVRLPDGFAFDSETTGKKFSEMAQKHGLKSAAAQELLELFAGSAGALNKAAVGELEKKYSGWAESLKADKEIGGADFDKNRSLARKAVVKFGSGELDKYLNDSGLGNHPELVKAFWRVGRTIGEDSISGTGDHAPPPSDDVEALAKQMYDHPSSQVLFGKAK